MKNKIHLTIVVEDRVETGVASASDEIEQKDTDVAMTNQGDTADTVSHEVAKDENSDDERWIAATGKHKATRFQDRSGHTIQLLVRSFN